ncbi:hypothetical protein D3C87_1970980 [compost metagenome]
MGLEVRWLEGNTGSEVATGQARPRRYPLAFDIFPGGSYRFEERLFAPETPGDYLVEVRFVDAFGTVATAQRQFTIKVEAN